MAENQAAIKKRLQIHLVKESEKNLVHAVPDSGSDINCMSKNMAKELKYRINNRWWHRRLVGSIRGQTF